MNNYRRKNYNRKRGYSGRYRRPTEPFSQPLPPDLSIIPYARHTLTKADVEAVVEALLSGTLTQGAELERFEGLLSRLTHSRHAVALSSGTAAIHAALSSLNLKEEDEVITSTLNFCAVANMVTMVGGKLILVDCDPDTLTISIDATREAISSHTRAIFANNFAGHPSDLNALRELCDEYDLVLLDDACHGLGGKYRGHYIGNQADLTCFSFHPSKAITTAEGGAVTTDSNDKANWIRMFRHHGIEKSGPNMVLAKDKPRYYQEVHFPGWNYRMSELHAALGRSQLTRLERHVERRRAIADYYFKRLEDIEELVLPFVADWADHAFHLFPVQLAGQLFGRRDAVFNDLLNEGIEAQVHYVPIHRMPFFKDRVGDPYRFPNAETYYHNCLSLPLFPDLSIKDLEKIADTFIKVITHQMQPGTTEVRREKPPEPSPKATQPSPPKEAREKEFKSSISREEKPPEPETDAAKAQDESRTHRDAGDNTENRDTKPDTKAPKGRTSRSRSERTSRTSRQSSRKNAEPESPPAEDAKPDQDNGHAQVSENAVSGGKLRMVPKEEELTVNGVEPEPKETKAPDKPRRTRKRTSAKTEKAKTAKEKAEPADETKTEPTDEAKATKPKRPRARKTTRKTPSEKNSTKENSETKEPSPSPESSSEEG